MLTQLSGRKFIFSLDTLANSLIPISLIYLAIPHIIFFLGWLNRYAAVVTVSLVIIPLGYIILQPHKASKTDTSDSPGITLSHLFIITALLFLIMMISGAGGFGYQDSDWKKHNALMKDLQERSWPTVYTRNGVSLPLVYNIAYYMPAALVGRISNNIPAQTTLFIWTFLGLFISALWFIILVRKNPYLSIALFVVFSGLDIIGIGVHRFLLGPLEDPLEYSSHIEFWAQNWQYSSHLTMVFWVPQHAFSGWIISGLLIYSMFYRPKRDEYLFYASLIPLWSPFVAVGILPILAVDFFTTSGSIIKRIKKYISLTNIFGLAIIVFMSVYYSSKFYPIPLPLKQPEAGLIFNNPKVEGSSWYTILTLMLWFIILEVGIYVAIIIRYIPLTNSKSRLLFLSSIIVLVLLPFFRYGKNNDLVMRGSIPALFLLAVLVGQAVAQKNLSFLARGVLIGVIFVGAVTPTMEVVRHLTEKSDVRPIFTPTLEETMDIIALQTDYETQSRLIQYVGSLNSPFFEYMINDVDCQIPPGVNIQPHNQKVVNYVLSDRFTVICINDQFTNNQLVVDLFLNTLPPPGNGEETHDTIFVQLVNDNGERIVGSDILLYKNYKDKAISSHIIQLPDNLKPGIYHLVVGTYYFEDSQLVNVGSATIDTPIIINQPYISLN